MSLIRKIRGLWRFDGDEEPIAVSRRSFLLLGGIATAGALLRLPGAEEEMSAEDASAMFRSIYKNVSVKLYDVPALETFLPYHFNPNAPEWMGIARGMRIPREELASRIRKQHEFFRGRQFKQWQPGE